MSTIKKEIPIGLYKDDKTNACLLNYKDAYQVLDRNNPADNRIMVYIKKYCEFLNYPVIHERQMTMDFHLEYEKLMNWIHGYNYAKEIIPKFEKHRVIIEIEDYYIIFCTPFSI